MKLFWNLLRKLSLTHWIFIALFAGFAIGVFFPELAPALKPFRNLFLNGVKCIIAPLIFSTIVTGIASAGSFKKLGAMGVRTLVYFEIVTTFALAFGLLAVNILKPGVGVDFVSAGNSSEVIGNAASSQVLTWDHFIEHLLPSNIAKAVVNGDVLQIVIFSTIFAFAVLAVGNKARPVLSFCEGLAEVMFHFTGYIMLLAPLGVGAAMATSLAEHGWQVIVPMLKLVGTLYITLIIFVICVFLPVLKIMNVPIKAFFRRVKDALFLAFATTSSESAYPMALNSMEKFGVPRRISSFVLPMGYSFNLDGSTLYLAIAAVFVAQVHGIELPLGTQLAMIASLMLTTKGVAAVPRTSIVVLTGTLTAFDIPLEAIVLIMAVDEFMDMARTGVNLLGNLIATAVVARLEGIPLGESFESIEQTS